VSVGHYENFPVASLLLPARQRSAVAAIYRFARSADDFADEGERAPAERLALLERYRAGIEKVTADDVARVARAYVHRDKLALLVVGKSQDFDRPLAGFGNVAALEIAIPEGAASGARQAAGSTPEGKALLARVVEAVGVAPQIVDDVEHQLVVGPLAGVKQRELLLEHVEQPRELRMLRMPERDRVAHS